MNKNILLFLSLFLIGCNNQKSSQDTQDNEIQAVAVEKTQIDPIKNIKDNFVRINNIKNWTSVIKKDLEQSTEGGEVSFYYNQNVLEKIEEKNYGCSGQNLYEYYFLDHKLSFVYVKEIIYNTNVADPNLDEEKYEIAEYRFYFKDDEIIKEIKSKNFGYDIKKSDIFERLKELEKIKG